MPLSASASVPGSDTSPPTGSPGPSYDSGRRVIARTAWPRSRSAGTRCRPTNPGETAMSVVVRGHARHLGEDEEHRVEILPLRPWVGEDDKYDVVEIVPIEVTGRRFRLDRPWLAARTDG